MAAIGDCHATRLGNWEIHYAVLHGERRFYSIGIFCCELLQMKLENKYNEFLGYLVVDIMCFARMVHIALCYHHKSLHFNVKLNITIQ